MNIQLNTDVHIDGTEALAAEVSAMIEKALEHFGEHVTRVEVHLSDENGDKNGQNDQRCMLEARLEGRQPVAVTDHAATLEQAVHGAWPAGELAEMRIARRWLHRDDNKIPNNVNSQVAGALVSSPYIAQLVAMREELRMLWTRTKVCAGKLVTICKRIS